MSWYGTTTFKLAGIAFILGLRIIQRLRDDRTVLSVSSNDAQRDPYFEGILDDTPEYVDATVGILSLFIADGRAVIEKDYRVAGEVWRVHKSDADPYPSNPHAHCVGGADRFVGRTLHLGTRQLFDWATAARPLP